MLYLFREKNRWYHFSISIIFIHKLISLHLCVSLKKKQRRNLFLTPYVVDYCLIDANLSIFLQLHVPWTMIINGQNACHDWNIKKNYKDGNFKIIRVITLNNRLNFSRFGHSDHIKLSFDYDSANLNYHPFYLTLTSIST